MGGVDPGRAHASWQMAHGGRARCAAALALLVVVLMAVGALVVAGEARARAHRADQNPDIKSGAEGGAPARLQPQRLELRPSPLAQAAPLPLSSA